MRDFLNGHGAVIGGASEAAQPLLVRRIAHGSLRRCRDALEYNAARSLLGAIALILGGVGDGEGQRVPILYRTERVPPWSISAAISDETRGLGVMTGLSSEVVRAGGERLQA